MRHELWRALLSASTDIDRQVASVAGELPSSVSVALAAGSRSSTPRDTSWRDLGEGGTALARSLNFADLPPPSDASSREREQLSGLRVQVRARLEQLWRALEGELGIDRIRRALVIYFDERVMSLLPEHLRLSWPLLQTEITRSTSGGSDFFRHIDEVLDDPKAPSLVFEVYYFCLEHGFVGMHVHEPQRIEEFKRRLAPRIDLPPVTRVGLWTPEETEGMPPRPWPLWVYYGIAFLVVASAMIFATVASNGEVQP